MGTWNYRALRHSSDGSIAIHEVFYDDNGRAYACTTEPTGLVADSLDDLRSSVMPMVLRALNEEVLEYDSFAAMTAAKESSV